MSTSRKLRVKLAKHRRSARKAARKEPEPEPAESSTAETQASTKRETVTARSALTKIYKVRPMLNRMLPLFRRYYSPRPQLSLDEDMIPTKNRLAIKQYILDKPVRWGFKSFLLCEAKTGYILNAEIYTGLVRDTGPSSDQLVVLSAVSWIIRRSPTRTTCCSWTAFTTPSRSSSS